MKLVGGGYYLGVNEKGKSHPFFGVHRVTQTFTTYKMTSRPSVLA